MGRVFFPTYRANVLGVRDIAPQTLLSGLEGELVIPRAPAEPFPRAVNHPTGPMLGAIIANGNGVMARPIYLYPGGSVGIPSRPIIYNPIVPPPVPALPYNPPVPIITHPVPVPAPAPAPIVASPGSPAQPPAPAAPPVSSQTSPTPTVTVPTQPASGAILVSSGGGTAAPATAPITIQTGGDTLSAVTAWLQGSTPILSYNVPNALLVAAVVLGFAMFSGGSSGRRR